MSTTELHELAMQLPPEERASLAHELLASLGESYDDHWLVEAESRAEAYAAGQLGADDWEASLARVRTRLEQRRAP